MSDDETALLKAVLTDPGDDTVRLVYADWCDENGRPERARFIRNQIRLAADGYPGPLPVRAARMGSLSPSLMTRHAAHQCCLDLHVHAAEWLGAPFAQFEPAHAGEWAFARGFVAKVVCTADDWLKWAGALVWDPADTVPCAAPGCEDGVTKWTHNGFADESCTACAGHGRVRGPYPPTAQPIERVTLIGSAPSSARTDYEPLPLWWFQAKWRGITFTFGET